MKSQSFEQLIVWQKAHSYVLAIYKITKQYPKEELFCLVNQMRRAAASITANIAEGYAKISSKDKLRFYNISQGSLEERNTQFHYPVERFRIHHIARQRTIRHTSGRNQPPAKRLLHSLVEKCIATHYLTTLSYY